MTNFYSSRSLSTGAITRRADDKAARKPCCWSAQRRARQTSLLRSAPGSPDLGLRWRRMNVNKPMQATLAPMRNPWNIKLSVWQWMKASTVASDWSVWKMLRPLCSNNHTVSGFQITNKLLKAICLCACKATQAVTVCVWWSRNPMANFFLCLWYDIDSVRRHKFLDFRPFHSHFRLCIMTSLWQHYDNNAHFTRTPPHTSNSRAHIFTNSVTPLSSCFKTIIQLG